MEMSANQKYGHLIPYINYKSSRQTEFVTGSEILGQYWKIPGISWNAFRTRSQYWWNNHGHAKSMFKHGPQTQPENHRFGKGILLPLNSEKGSRHKWHPLWCLYSRNAPRQTYPKCRFISHVLGIIVHKSSSPAQWPLENPCFGNQDQPGAIRNPIWNRHLFGATVSFVAPPHICKGAGSGASSLDHSGRGGKRSPEFST
jgi:hypothetical protein